MLLVLPSLQAVSNLSATCLLSVAPIFLEVEDQVQILGMRELALLGDSGWLTIRSRPEWNGAFVIHQDPDPCSPALQDVSTGLHSDVM